MRRPSWIWILVIVLLAASAALFYWALSPRLLGISPPDGTRAAPARTSLRLEFSRPMRSRDVLQRLSIQPPIQGVYSWQAGTLTFTPEKNWPPGETIQVSLAPGARADGWLGLPLRSGASWSFNIAQPRLLYLYPHDEPADIYVLDPYSATSQRWTRSLGGVTSYSANAQGTVIYYSLRNGQGSSAIYRLDIPQDWQPPDKSQEFEGGELPEPVLVLDCPSASCRNPVVSPKGDFLAYERAAFVGGADPSFLQVWLLALDPQGNPAPGAQPTLADPELHQTLNPAWSSQGILAFYNTNLAEFFMLDPSQGILARFANQTGQPGDWHPNGRDFLAPEIFFLGEKTAPGLDELQPLANSQLMLYQLDGKVQNLTPEEELEDTSPAFSPDGAYLAFARKSLHIQSWTPGRQLWIMRTGTWEAQSLTDDELYNHYDFAWSPSSDLLAYVRFNQSSLSEPPELWLMDPFSGNSTRLLIGGYRPAWVP